MQYDWFVVILWYLIYHTVYLSMKICCGFRNLEKKNAEKTSTSEKAEQLEEKGSI